MRLYFGGAEVPSWRTLLAERQVSDVSLSYMGLRRRVKFTKPWLLQDKFPEEQNIFLDSGAYTVNNDDGDKFTISELKDIAAHYMSFVDQNIDRIDMVSEFDAVVLGQDWIEAMREDFYEDLPDDKFLPIWHPEFGLDYLDQLAQRYARVGIMQTALDGRNLTPTLNSLTNKYGTKLHGIAMTKPDVMAAVNFDSVASTSWISPSQYGDTIIWTGKELKRYPKRYKDQARKRHRTYLEDNGFDSEAIENDDSKEILRLSIWSWQQQMVALGHQGVTTSPESDTLEFAELDGMEVDMETGEVRNSVSTAVTPRDRDRVTLPLLRTVTKEVASAEGGDPETVTLLSSRSSSMRVCDSCFLAKKCPAFESGANCAYDIPMEIRTKDQMKALQDALIEIQAQRVMFMRMAEDLEGGYADPNLSGELDRLQKMIKTATELEQDNFSIKFEAKGSGNGGSGGVLSRLFGREAADTALALPGGPVSAEEASKVIDVDFVDNN